MKNATNPELMTIFAQYDQAVRKAANSLEDPQLREAQSNFVASITAAINSGSLTVEDLASHIAQKIILDRMS